MAATIDPQIFTDLQSKIDIDTTIREQLKTHIETLSKEGRLTSSILAQIHNVPTTELPARVLQPATQAIQAQITTLQSLAKAASAHPFYKWNTIWQRDVQNLLSSLQLVAWLETSQLITLENVGSTLGVPVN
ncbi:Translin-1, partial [Elasticomyces elasticus]